MWRSTETDAGDKLLLEVIGTDRAEQLDRFEKVQLEDVLKVCRESKNMSEAGRKVFAVSRKNKKLTTLCEEATMSNLTEEEKLDMKKRIQEKL